jgi:hypothetical protein
LIKETANQLVDTDAEKFMQLAEELAFENEETFATKLETVKDTYFTGTKVSSRKQLQEEFITNEPIEDLNEEVRVDPAMARYMNALVRR